MKFKILSIIMFLFTLNACDVLSKSSSYSNGSSSYPHRAENGDYYNYDNDGDGRKEPVHVKGYYRKDGTYVREHYRAKPRSKGY